MAFQPSSLTILRVITQRLASTAAWQLPNIVAHLASSLTACKDILATSDLRQQRHGGSDAAILVHKFKTQLSTLLQDRSPEARWAAIVLVKATVETGGWEVQRGCGPWVRGLLGILSKKDPPTTKQLCIITLTRIFQLIEEHQSLVREITTPSLPGFITSCLKLVKSRTAAKEVINSSCHETTLNTVFQCFCTLLPHHPTLFRPFLSQIRSLITPLIAATPSSIVIDEDPEQRLFASATCVPYSSRQLFALLCNCAPKNNSAEDWAEAVHSIINSLHRNADRAFRAVIEDWEPSASRVPLGGKLQHDFSDTVGTLDEDDLGLPAWRGIHAGLERIDGLLRILQVFLTTPTKSSVRIPVGAVIDVADRILSITLPSGETETEYSVPTFNPEAGREEREGLWTGLPMINVAALEVLSLLIQRLGRSSAIACYFILERSLWVFEAQRANDSTRAIIYKLISYILQLVGWSLPKSVAPLLSSCVKNCCEDLVLSKKDQALPSDDPATSLKIQNSKSASMNADFSLKFPDGSSSLSENSQDIESAAALLLSVSVSHMPRDFFADALRAQIDRTAILIKSKPTMLASALTPPTRRQGAGEPSSVIPLLAREFPSSLEVEMLVRPRMPVVKTQKNDVEPIISYVNVSEGLEGQTLKHHEQITEPIHTQYTDDSTPQERIESHEHLTTNFTETRETSTTQPIDPSHEPPETTPLIPPQKRSRDSPPTTDPYPETADPELPSRASSPSRDRPSKRARFDLDSPSLEEQAQLASHESGLVQRDLSTGGSEDPSSTAVPKGTMPWTPPAAKPGQDMDTSDESDFEMPVIDLRPDTSDEDEDENDEGEGE